MVLQSTVREGKMPKPGFKSITISEQVYEKFYDVYEKNKDKLKYYDETIVYFDLISKKEYKDIFDTLPSQIKKKLFSKENLKKSLKILEQKPRESKEFFTRRIRTKPV